MVLHSYSPLAPWSNSICVKRVRRWIKFLLFGTGYPKKFDFLGENLQNSKAMIKLSNFLEEKLYPRKLLTRIAPWMRRKEALVFLGPRRSGKTSLLKLIALQFHKSSEEVFFFDAEDPDDKDVLDQGPTTLKQFLGRGGVLFIDEFHLLEDPAKFVKLLVDHHPEFKLFLTGSSSLTMLRKFSDSLIGRIVEFELLPLSFNEFLVFKEQTRYGNLLEGFDRRKAALPNIAGIPERLVSLFEEYLLFGGFPEVVIADPIEVKTKIVSQIFGIYALRDLQVLFAGRNEAVFKKVFVALSGSIGNPINFSEIASDVGVSNKTVRQYVDLLKGLFLIKELTPLSQNPRTEIKKSPKIYFTDTGLLSWARGGFALLGERPTLAGLYAENAVFMGFQRTLMPEEGLFYWRSKTGTEIDLIWSRGQKLIPIEVKYTQRANLKALVSFVKRYANQIEYSITSTKDHFEPREINGIKVLLMPALFLA